MECAFVRLSQWGVVTLVNGGGTPLAYALVDTMNITGGGSVSPQQLEAGTLAPGGTQAYTVGMGRYTQTLRVENPNDAATTWGVCNIPDA